MISQFNSSVTTLLNRCLSKSSMTQQMTKNQNSIQKYDLIPHIITKQQRLHNIIIVSICYVCDMQNFEEGYREKQHVELVHKQPDFNSQLFPFCIVWTMIPCISWLIPTIGHTGICDDQGVIYDFLGFHINKREMAFGNPRKYVKLDIPQNEITNYLTALHKINQQYSSKGHDLCCNNCHHHVAAVLNQFKYRNRTNWNQVSIWWMCIWESKYVSWFSLFITYLPFLIIAIGIVLICTLSKK